MAATPIKVAVVLGGCGRADGSEIQESVSVLVHLARHGAKYECFAPDAPQADVINHATGKPMAESRNLMVEAARISRGQITPLGALDPAKFDAVIFPGGFGAAKNLCTFAKDGASCSVLPDVERVMKGFASAGKPLGLVCIAPVMAARVFGVAKGGAGVKLTIGTDDATAQAIGAMGATHVPKDTTQACVDAERRVVTTPAYMHDHATPYEVFTGIGKLVDEVVALAKR
jgi:enhancing lycopene biosynthesis protein 2